MKILLISPVAHPDHVTNRELMIPQLALYILEGLTPHEHEVTIIEEETKKIDLDQPCDLVGISCMTANAPRAYQLCKAFRKRGKTVVLGGVHPTLLPDEALQHADSVVIGEAEGVWEDLLNDFLHRLKRRYHNPSPNLDRYLPKNFSNITRRRLLNVIPVMTTRGCPYQCEFCCVSNIFGKKIRHLPIENVVREIKQSQGKHFIFLDDNIIGNPRYARELFKAIRPLNISWGGQASVSLLAKNHKLMKLAGESGCKTLFLGLESIAEEQLKSMRKSFTEIKHLEKALLSIKQYGILIHASMVFGFDSDTMRTFADTVKFLIRNKVSTVSFNVLTPYPGTQVYDQFISQDRLTTRNWQYYDHNTVVFTPQNMTPLELQMGKLNARKKFYSLRSVIQRFSGNLYNPLLYLATNYGHMKQVRVEAKKVNSLKHQIF